MGREYFSEFVRSAVGQSHKILFENLFDLCVFLSRSGFELRPVNGLIAILDSSKGPLPLAIALESPVASNDHYGARKLVLSSSDEYPAACNGDCLSGLLLRSKALPNYLIRFQKSGVWELLTGRHVYAAFRDDTPLGHEQILRKGVLIGHILEYLGPVPAQSLERIWGVVCEAAGQNYGTNILITSAAAEEAHRLSSHDTRISPVALTPSLIAHLSRLDGTIIIDEHGICHAIGAILDGRANTFGNWRRGGRYNSAIMYAGSSSAPCVIVIVSQEGFIDLVSSKMPGVCQTNELNYWSVDSGTPGVEFTRF